MEPADPAPSSRPLALPVDPRSFLHGLWGAWPWVIATVLLGGVVGYLASQTAAKRIFKAETVMLYDASTSNEDGQGQAPSLFTEIAMVKLPVHVAALREKLSLHATIDQIAAAVQVNIQPKTALVSMTAQWDDPKMAAAIANGLRDIFLESRQKVHRDRITGNIDVLNKRLEPVKAALAQADEKLGAYARTNQIVDLTEEAKALLQEQMTLNVFYGQAVAEREVALKQAKEVQEVIREVQERVAQEAKEAKAHTDALSETNIRIQRLRESISDDQRQRVEGARLREKQMAAERARTALDSRAISRADFDAAVSELRVQEALTLETTQTLDWKRQIEDLDQRVIPSQGGNTVSGNLLLAVLTREFEIKMQAISVEQKVAQLDAARNRVIERLSRIPQIEREYVELKRRVAVLETEVTGLEGALALARKELELRGVRFSTIVEARQPIRPSRSNTRMLFAAGFVGVCAIGFSLILAWVTYRLRPSSLLELKFWTGADGLAEIPSRTLVPHGHVTEYLSILADQIRTQAPPDQRCLLLCGAHPKTPTADMALDLGASLALRGERVLVLLADCRASGQAPGFPLSPDLDLSRWLDQAPALPLKDFITAVDVPGLGVLGFSQEKPDPRWLLRPAFTQLLDAAQALADRVIVVGPAPEPWVDIRVLASHCSSTLLLVQAGQCSFWTLKKSAGVVQGAAKHFLGAIMADVLPRSLLRRFPSERAAQ